MTPPPPAVEAPGGPVVEAPSAGGLSEAEIGRLSPVEKRDLARRQAAERAVSGNVDVLGIQAPPVEAPEPEPSGIPPEQQAQQIEDSLGPIYDRVQEAQLALGRADTPRAEISIQHLEDLFQEARDLHRRGWHRDAARKLLEVNQQSQQIIRAYGRGG